MQKMQRVQSLRQARKQKGFTIIELVVVILLLGILAATALPRFMDVTDEAHAAVVDAVDSGLVTGAALFRAQWIATGQVPDTALADFGDGTLRPTAQGYPKGTTTAYTATSCLEVYNGLLQSGRPTATSVAGASSAGTPSGGVITYTTTATAAAVDTAASTTNDIVALTGSGVFYCKDLANDGTCDGTPNYYSTSADAIASTGSNVVGTTWTTIGDAQNAVLASGAGSCTYYYTGQYKRRATGLTIPTLTLSLSTGAISRGTLTYTP